MKLIDISNGNWLDPKIITSIRAADQVPAIGLCSAFPARIIVHAGNTTTIIDCDDFSQAQAAANELAERVNNLMFMKG